MPHMTVDGVEVFYRDEGAGPAIIFGHSSQREGENTARARGIVVSHETVRQWALKFGQAFANEIRRRLPRAGDKWHFWLWRAVDQHGIVLDVLVQSRRDAKAAKRLLRKLPKRQGRAPRVMITDKLASYLAAKKELMLVVGALMIVGAGMVSKGAVRL